MDNEKVALEKLVSLLNNKESTLIIIEPTEKMTVKNVKAFIRGIKTFWFYKGLLVWANAREGKAVSKALFEKLDEVTVSHTYHLNDMVRVTYIRKKSLSSLTS